ncbi:MAG: hypothetical protein MUE33_04375 [Cytophagaceae bacterium]|jgi:hypothetical protein|nr:hypothetical protein [Cytophagaceae bacterium]
MINVTRCINLRYQSVVLLFLSISLNLLLTSVFSYLFKVNLELTTFYNIGGDSQEYIGYAENLLNKNKYIYEGNEVGRMPLYSIIIYFLMMIFDKHWALNLVLILQSIFHGIATFYLSKTAYLIRPKLKFQIIVFIIYQFCFVTRMYDSMILTESLAHSFIILNIYFFIKYFKSLSYKYIFYSGLFIALSIFLRPFFIIYFFILSAYIFWNFRLKSLKILTLFTLPFFVMEISWITRNYVSTQKIIFFQENTYSGMVENNTPYLALWNYVKNTGEDIVWWQPNSYGQWLLNITNTYKIPEHLLSTSVGISEINTGKKLYQLYQKEEDLNKKNILSRQVIQHYNYLDSIYKTEKPLEYYFFSRIRLFKLVLLRSGPMIPVKSYPYIYDNKLELLIKLSSIATYQITLILGMSFLIFVVIQRPNIEKEIFLFIFLIICMFLFLNQVLRYTEFRLYSSIFIFLGILTAYVVDLFTDKVFKKN